MLSDANFLWLKLPWIEASASGWGVLALLLIVVVLFAATRSRP